ncbi:hypothetical protein COCSUDRAFT_48661 [Coccomyxa subellipsoidea C-169]|uniref:Uncharacterized protein n=1 Tax=Coccomyxa subellipsoidea (strain C-169) TaxID=574566 RepID=I0YPC0_COCSC|nr:hypothetical protein COCSUDRAFT_48661 [Coccomyxa subellipsoidea C-169]EIE20239.1 hypothetical protein COCSUDRAFT_48661 [Coccomyxa subellipsoidea C-169]|eukprot:XP_005644783.1 hypothetical protein COCSUDRAFT_48661 [Coccomyxa subellipsoidea C-169]
MPAHHVPSALLWTLHHTGQLALRGRAHATTQRAAREMQRQHKPATMLLPAQVQQACPGDHSQLKEGVLLSSGPPEATPQPPPLRLPLLLRRQSLGPLPTSCSASGPYSSIRGRRSLGSRFAAAHLRHRVLVAPEDQSPQEATREQQSPEDGQGPSNHRPAGWRAGSRPASFTGSALPPMAHSIGQLPNGAAARGTPSTTAACAQARLSPDLQVATSPARRGPQLRSQLGANIGGDNAAPGDGHPAPAPHDDHAPLRAARRSKRRLAGGDATDSQAPASKARRGPVHAGAVDSLPAAEDAAGPSGRAAAPPLDADSPDDTAQEVRSAEAARPDAPTEPVEVAGNPHCAGGQRAHALRPAGSTMAAEGHVFAVANSSAERPTASTGTSRPRDIPRPRREDGRESELQSRLHAERHGPAAPAAAQPGAAAAPGPRSVDPRSLPFPVPLPRRGRSPAAPAASSAMFGIPEWPAPPPAAGANGHAQRSAQVAAVASSVSAAERARAGPSRAGSSQQEGRHNDAAAAGEASQGGGPTGYGVASPDRDGGGRADSLPSSAAAIVGEDREPDTVGRPAARLSRRRGVDSAVGAIVETGDGDEGDGEEVDESGMFQRSFSGHYNRVGCKEVALMGSHSQYVVSGSDDGHIFVWQRGTGQLVNLLRSSDTGVSCVAPHPHLPMLASCGQDPVVRLWSPEAAEMASLENAEAVMRRNAAELTERAAAAAGPPALWLNMIAPPGLAAELEQRPRSPRGHQADRGDNPVRCSLM